MNRNYRYSCKRYISFENPKERWIQMHDVFQGNYFISSEGRVMRLTPNGIFKEVLKKNQKGSLMAVLYNHKDNRIASCRVARLVLTYFVGGAYPYRRYAFKNKDKTDCRLKNVYWKCGFDTGIDYKYLFDLKHCTLNWDDIKIVEYFHSKDIGILFNLVEYYRRKLHIALVKKMFTYDIKANISTIVLELSEKLLKGFYKPVSNLVRYEKVDFLNFLINLTMRIAAKEKKYVFASNTVTEESFFNVVTNNF